MAGVYGDNIGRWQVESEHFSSRAAVGLCVTSGEVGSMGFVPSRIVLSTAGTHTLWMFVAGGAGSTVSAPWGRRRFMTGCAVSGSMLMCRQVVLISMVTQAGTALMSTCLVRPWWWGPSGPGARGLAGHPGRERTYSEARRAGGELGAGRAWGPGAAIASEVPAGAAPQQAGHSSAGAADDLLAAPAAVVGDRPSGHRAAAAARSEGAPRHAQRQWARRCFRDLGREDPGIGSLAEAVVCCGRTSPGRQGRDTSQDRRSRRT